ncbi:MAG: hypothetical protein JJV97_01275 [SAR324 cluster bacterium]|nr:hypothetical protein [SAR324 cluster bacterium]
MLNNNHFPLKLKSIKLSLLGLGLVCLLASLYPLYGQTTDNEIPQEEEEDDEKIFYSDLQSTAAKDSTTDSTADVEYGPWGCQFTLQPFSVTCGSEEIIPPPPDIIKEQVEILDFLRGRKQKLDTRELTIVDREKGLSALESRIEQKINEVARINQNIEKMRQEKAITDTETLRQLVSYYEKIPAENAAVFFNQMDQQTSTMILTRMKSRKAAALLANLSPEVAVSITEYVAKIAENREAYLSLPKYDDLPVNPGSN